MTTQHWLLIALLSAAILLAPVGCVDGEPIDPPGESSMESDMDLRPADDFDEAGPPPADPMGIAP